jgi:hypothetical protein
MARDRLELLEKCLEEFNAKNVLVLGFLPPFSSESGALLQASATHSNLWNQVRSEVPKIFREKNLPFVDASMVNELGLNDAYMIDGIHAAETFHLRLLLKFLSDARVEKAFPNLAAIISASLNSPATNPWRPDYGPFFGKPK